MALNTARSASAAYRASPVKSSQCRFVWTQVDLEQLSKSRFTGLSEEVIVSVTIDFEWLDQRNGTTLVARRAFTGTGLFVPSQPTAEPIELGRFAAVQQLARDIVSELQAEW